VACKTNLDEFAMGGSTEFSVRGPARHPLDLSRVPGGSSGGSAVLVADGSVNAALGSETGGSVRQPAGFCGVVGVKPTYGRVSRYGLVAFASSLDQVGVFGRSVAHAAEVLAIISGADPRDATCADLPPLSPGAPRPDLRGVVIGKPHEYFPADLDPVIRRASERALETLRGLGAVIRPVSLPHTDLAVPAYYVLAPAEASSNLARYDGVRYGQRHPAPPPDISGFYRATRGAGFGPEVRRRIIIGTWVLSAGYYHAYYARALAARALIRRDFDQVFGPGGVDLLFTPTTPTTAFRIGEKVNDPVAMYRADAFVCTANLAGVPALSLPIARGNGLPVGGQFIGPHFSETLLLGVAEVLERHLDARAEVG